MFLTILSFHPFVKYRPNVTFIVYSNNECNSNFMINFTVKGMTFIDFKMMIVPFFSKKKKPNIFLGLMDFKFVMV